ncbi:MAG: aminotransferase class V-fold PLP-dependent enzyme [Bacteroidetes bacterium]|nr:aminotransferase class V-fold PLP-dependent enzyme [Bacteroidota bacterium]
MKRRQLLKYASLSSLAGVSLPLLPGTVKAGEVSTFAKRDLFAELGIRTFINAAGTYTAMTASLMRPEAMDAIRQASHKFCMLDELQDKVGERIASMTHAEAAVVTSGAFAALTLGMAGILTGMDPVKVKSLPKLEGTGMKMEVICQKAHAIGYNQALTNTGVKVIMIETREELIKAINKNTAAMHFLHINADRGQIQHEEWVEIGKKYGIPTTIDIAADVPPVSNLWRFNDMGFHFVAISGGKALRGPQSAGILMGKKEVIAAARLSMPPRGETIGRGMKVNKEEVLGMYVALESFMAIDHDEEYKMFQKRIDKIKSAVDQVSGITTVVNHPKLGNVTPTLNITWDATKIKKDGNQLREDLRKGDPSIEVVGGKDNLSVTTWSLQEGEDKIVAARLKEVLMAASV